MNKRGIFSYFFAILAGVSLMLNGCVTLSQPKYAPQRYVDDIKNVEHAMNSTVSLYDIVHDSNYCTGFFVSEDMIMTARHCVVSTDEMDVISEDSTLQLKNELYQTMFFIVEYPSYKNPSVNMANDILFAHLVYVDLNTQYEDVEEFLSNDIAILKLNSGQKRKTTSWFKIAEKNAKHGEQVYAVGMPNGIPWIMSQGMVSQYLSEKGITDSSKVMMTYINAYYGSSGGPVFNNSGEIVGLASAIETKMKYLCMGPSTTSIHNFLYGNI